LEYGVAQDSDVIITMCCGYACPVFPGKRYEGWNSTTGRTGGSVKKTV
jgi:hypothetical protein